jgi:hypothetical protein
MYIPTLRRLAGPCIFNYMNKRIINEIAGMKRLMGLQEQRTKKKEVESYFDTYSAAISAALDDTREKGYDVDEDDIWMKISVGEGRPKVGKSQTVSLTLYKNGKEQRRALHISVYAMEGGQYELTHYIL